MNRVDQFIPHLVVRDGIAAIKFYKETFGAEEGHQMMSPDGKKLMHGEIVLDGHKIFVSDEFEKSEGGSLKTPEHLGGTTARVTVEVDDADALIARAVAAGATVMMPVADMFWGARYGKIVDPFGHEWGVNQQLQQQTDEETNAAAEKFFEERK
jgi:PhnB protein